jgi:hypothetical protein
VKLFRIPWIQVVPVTYLIQFRNHPLHNLSTILGREGGFNRNVFRQLETLANQHLPLSQIQPLLAPEYEEIFGPTQNQQTERSIEPNCQNLLVDNLFRESYETLLKQLYGIPVQLPEYLVINGLRANFVPFEQIGQMLSTNQIERYIIDPLLQPWAGIPPAGGASPGTEYRIFTFFGKNGITYLVRAKYNSQTNQILA